MIYTGAVLLAHFLTLFFTGTWKRWKEYYSTALFVAIGDFTYDVIFSERLLWKYNTLFDYRIADIVYALLVFPCAVMLFLRYFPKGTIKRFLYIIMWTSIYTFIECISVLTGNFYHYDGWNLLWSAGLYFFAFILARIHYVKPLVVWPISLGFVILMMIIFKQPFHLSAIK